MSKHRQIIWEIGIAFFQTLIQTLIQTSIQIDHFQPVKLFRTYFFLLLNMF